MDRVDRIVLDPNRTYACTRTARTGVRVTKGYTLSVVVMSDSVDVTLHSMVRNMFFGIKNDCLLR